jgi:hypothetical protein
MSLHRSILALALAAASCTPEEECAYQRPEALIELISGDGTINSQHEFSACNSFVSCDREHSYSWSLVRVPGASQITDSVFSANNLPGACNQKLNFDVPGTYVIQLTIFDGIQNSVENLYVVEIASDNLQPEADAGADQSAFVDQRASFDGSESYDPELEELTFEWTLEGKPEGSRRTSADIFDADEPTPAFIGDVPGTYVFGLRVRDEFLWSAKDYVSLVVISDNQPPIAQASDSASPMVELTACQSLDPVSLNGSRSWDPEGSPLTYEWGLVSKPAASRASTENFDNPTSARPLFRTDAVGEYTFELRVNDGTSWSAWDNVSVTTKDLEENTPPTANAGADFKVDVEAKCYTFGSSTKCGDCPVPEFDIDASKTSDPDGDELNYLWLVTAGEGLSISYPEGPVTTARPPTIPGEFGRTITRTWDLQVRASDCEGESTDTVRLTMTCVGKR